MSYILLYSERYGYYEALIIDGENEVRCLPYGLQVRYPLKDFTVCDIKE